MSVVSAVVAVIGFALAALWCAMGFIGLIGRLPRNKYFGVRSDETMRSKAAFTLANRVAAPGMLAAAAVTAAGAGMALGVDGLWGLVFAVSATLVSLLVIGMVSSLGIRAAAAVPVPDEGSACGSGCCSGDREEAGCSDGDAADGSPAADSPAADCGQASCGACALSGMCTDEAPQATP